MRQARLLRLNDMDLSNHTSKDVPCENSILELGQPGLENASRHIWPVGCFMIAQQLTCDFRPLGVTGQGDTEVRLAMVTNNDHGILRNTIQTCQHSWPECLGRSKLVKSEGQGT